MHIYVSTAFLWWLSGFMSCVAVLILLFIIDKRIRSKKTDDKLKQMEKDYEVFDDTDDKKY